MSNSVVNITPDEELGQQVANRRIMFSMLRPAALLAARLGFPLKELTNFIRLSYFRELRDQGATLAEAAETMEVSTRTAKRLAQDLRSDFFVPEIEHTLARQIEFMLWAEPVTLARIKQLLPGVPDAEIQRALEKLEEEERVERIDGRSLKFAATQPVTRIVDEAFSRRIGALNSLLQNVAETVVSRFIDIRPVSFARTLNFRILEEDAEELKAAYRTILERMVELEERIEPDSESIPVRLSMLWSELDE